MTKDIILKSLAVAQPSISAKPGNASIFYVPGKKASKATSYSPDNDNYESMCVIKKEIPIKKV